MHPFPDKSSDSQIDSFSGVDGVTHGIGTFICSYCRWSPSPGVRLFTHGYEIGLRFRPTRFLQTQRHKDERP